MHRTVVSTTNAPAAVGPYSQAIRIGDLVYTAGQIGIVPASGTIEGRTIEEQTHQVLRNLRAVLEAAGTSLEKVVKTTVFLADMNDFKAMNAVYATYFPSEPPARSAFGVAALPLGAMVEIEAVALAG
ncbi:MAG TPA: RidA family protein [Thermoanaerobaculales bacterium]|nr:RidA family protein [Thermoanaerobaculales bacterium]HPA80006.1 RidA family protein [Thermoanaerobaculales bacterium]HQL30321.1 RidA family protein [Thermoanaerobaculales bacterium]HQN95296.1 RidA family protein [Thermoanaerobaculales bacterium]HQP42327.1 RidA family protein [Thermoanaerobaculales bacterium]